MIVQNDYSFIGSDIRKIREAKGITRKEIAEKKNWMIKVKNKLN